jgi:hypothetical protein
MILAGQIVFSFIFISSLLWLFPEWHSVSEKLRAPTIDD